MFDPLWKAAFKRTASQLKLDKPVIAVILAVGTTAFIWWLTGQPAWGGLAGIAVSLAIFAPTFLYNLVKVADERFEEGERKLAEARELLTSRREPDALYQFDRKVAHTLGGDVDVYRGIVRFRIIEGTADFNANASFEYRDFRARVLQAGSTDIMGAGVNRWCTTLSEAICQIES